MFPAMLRLPEQAKDICDRQHLLELFGSDEWRHVLKQVGCQTVRAIWWGSAMKLICSVALALALLIQPTSSKADVGFAGVGAISCGKISQDYQSNPTEIETVMMTWAQGFMSGMNRGPQKGAQNSQYRDMAAMTIEAQQASLRKYCDEHPTAEFWKAVLDLYFKLPLKKYPAAPIKTPQPKQ